MTLSPMKNPRMARVQLLTTVMILLTVLFCAYWSVSALRFISYFIFGDGMQGSPFIDAGVTVGIGQRVAYFVVWAVVVGSAWFTFYAAVMLLLAFRAGAFFTVPTCRRMQILGAALVATIIADTALTVSIFSIMTWSNPVDGAVGFVGPALAFNSSNITIMLCGLGFFSMGWVLYEGAQIAEDNKGFI